MIKIAEEFLKTDLSFDKTTQGLTALPFGYDDLKVKENAYVTTENINDITNKLFFNLLYLYKNCNVAFFKMFDSYLYSLSSSSVSPFLNPVTPGYTFTNTNNSAVSGSKKGIILPYNEGLRGSFSIIAGKDYITTMFLSQFQSRIINTSNKINLPRTDGIAFKNITDIKTDYTNYIYVCDNEYDGVYQFDVRGMITGENIYGENLFLKKSLGGRGVPSDRTKFNNIQSIAVGENIVIIQDAGNASFKIYDKELNWLNTEVFKKTFERPKVFSDHIITENEDIIAVKDKSLFIFSKVSSDYKYNFLKEIDLSIRLDSSENIKQIQLFNGNKKIIYLITNKTIKKLWITSLDVIGSFTLEGNTSNDIVWGSSAKFNDSKDIFVLYARDNANREHFSINLDVLFIDSLFKDREFLIYSKDECLIKSNEYVQSWSILNGLKKLNYNSYILLQNISFKYEEDVLGPFPKIINKIYNSGFLSFVNENNFTANFNIGINEIFQSDVINRCIKEVVDFQTLLLIYIINNKTNREFLSPEPEKQLNFVKEQIYFSDDSILLNPNPVKLDIFGELTPLGGILVSLGGAPYKGIGGLEINEGINI